MATIVEQLQQRLRMELRASKMRLSISNMEFQRTYAKKKDQYKWKLVGDGHIVIVSNYQVRELLKSSPSWLLTKQGNYIVVTPRVVTRAPTSQAQSADIRTSEVDKLGSLIPKVNELIQHADKGIISPKDALVELGSIMKAAFNILVNGVNR